MSTRADTSKERRPWIFANPRVKRVLGILIVFAHVLGLLASVDAVMRNRTAQGAIAWAVSLNAFPYVMVPIDAVFGRQKFEGWVEVRRDHEVDIEEFVDALEPKLEPFALVTADRVPDYDGLMALSGTPFLRRNAVELLVDGEETFDSIIDGIVRAEDYVLVEFYIVHDDGSTVVARTRNRSIRGRHRDKSRSWQPC